MLGMVVGALLFGKPEIILLMGLGSAIPDLDREYGFMSKESFRNRQPHRALCHNLLFLGIVYLVNPFIALGAFLHTFLDAFTTARDRGVEWLYPFTRLVKKSVYDYDGKRQELDPNHKVYLLQNELPVLTEKTTKDIKPGEIMMPWRRTYGPALSGGLLDQGIVIGSIALLLLLLLFSALGFRQFIDVNAPAPSVSFYAPFILGAAGVIMNFAVGEIDRKKLRKNFKPDREYKALFYFSAGFIVLSVILGGVMNPEIVTSTASNVPYIAAGAALLALVSFVLVKVRSSRPLPTDDKKEPVIV
jgi:amino acid transporter